MLTIALLSDIHHGPDRGTKKGSSALPLLEKFVGFVAQLNPDFTVEFGDRTSDSDTQTDSDLLREVTASLKKIPGKTYHLIGNHDVANMTVAEAEALLKAPLSSSSVDIKGFHFVFWNPSTKLDYKKGFSLQEGDLAWLQKDLAQTQLPTIIFSHVPLDNGSMKGNFYFEKAHPTLAAYPETQGEAIREVIERHGHVVLCVNGHAHWNACHCIDGTHYVTIPSLTETCTTWPHPNEAYATLRLTDVIEIEVFGRTPLFYRLPFKQAGTHWANKHKDYSPTEISFA